MKVLFRTYKRLARGAHLVIHLVKLRAEISFVNIFEITVHLIRKLLISRNIIVCVQFNVFYRTCKKNFIAYLFFVFYEDKFCPPITDYRF